MPFEHLPMPDLRTLITVSEQIGATEDRSLGLSVHCAINLSCRLTLISLQERSVHVLSVFGKLHEIGMIEAIIRLGWTRHTTASSLRESSKSEREILRLGWLPHIVKYCCPRASLLPLLDRKSHWTTGWSTGTGMIGACNTSSGRMEARRLWDRGSLHMCLRSDVDI